MKATDLQISAVQCWTSLEENLGVVPCTVMSMMSESLLSSACEVDVCGVLGMHALQLASETPSALLDWNNNYGERSEQSGVLPLQQPAESIFSRSVKMDFQEIIAGTVGKENTFGTCVGQVKAGAMSFARFSTDDTSGECAATRAAGDLRTIRWKRLAARAWWKFPGCRNCCTTSAKTDSSITWRRISPRVAPAVHEAASRYLGWDMYAHTA